MRRGQGSSRGSLWVAAKETVGLAVLGLDFRDFCGGWQWFRLEASSTHWKCETMWFVRVWSIVKDGYVALCWWSWWT